jgi:hypothetical protein
MNEKESQGRLANKHGEKNRDAVAGILLAHGFEDIGPLNFDPSRFNVLERFEKQRLMTLGQPSHVYAADVPICYSIYGFKYDANFLLRTDSWPEPMALMCRTQKSGGSALEKFESMYANLDERFPCRSIVMLSLTASDTLHPPVIRAVYERADSWVKRSKGRIGRIFRGLDDFRRWLSDYAPYPAIPSQEMF